MLPNVTPEPKLTRPQELALAALLTGESVQAAADAAKVQRRSVWRWLQPGEPLRLAYDQQRRQLVEESTGVLIAAGRRAAEVLRDLLAANPTLSSQTNLVRLRAAQLILERNHEAVTVADLSARIAALEEQE